MADYLSAEALGKQTRMLGGLPVYRRGLGPPYDAASVLKENDR